MKKTLDLFLKNKAVELPTGALELPRLSKEFGEKVEIGLKALSYGDYIEAQEKAMPKSRNVQNMDANVFQTWVLIYGITDPSPKDKDLQAHLGCHTPVDVVQQMFLPGEISALAEKIIELSGFGDSIEEDAKN